MLIQINKTYMYNKIILVKVISLTKKQVRICYNLKNDNGYFVKKFSIISKDQFLKHCEEINEND